MKSEFALALNQIVAERNLPREMISQVLESALTLTYRKNADVLTSQNVAVKMDIEHGDVRILVEKEVVEDLFDGRTEISLTDARAQDENAQLGDVIMADVTAQEFNKIAAQNAKQMIVQKLREAEREFQYNQFAERVGEIVTGIVQSVSPSSVVISLGRAEGVLNRKDQLPGERYELQQKVRAYVAEVKHSNRGMQIVLSRANKNMLRRLLEIEVPEVGEGKVEVKAIAREPGSRSKVAVASKEPGLDPVGACIGQRGVRIQGIVGELRNEKIDVIEYSEDIPLYIGKALSPAKVLAVFPNPHAQELDRESRTASVVVPDDQLSLAIGREGQNARLAAKLTGWRIDIKSGSEALGEAVAKITDSEAVRAHVGPAVVSGLPQLREMLVRQRAMPAPLSTDEFAMARRALEGVREYELAHGPVKSATSAPPIADVEPIAAPPVKGASIPPEAYDLPVESLTLSPRVTQHLVQAGYKTLGQLLELQSRTDDGLLAIEGIGPKAYGELRAAVDHAVVLLRGDEPEPVAEEPVALEPTAAAAEAPAVEDAGEPAATAEEELDFESFEPGEDEDDEDRDAASLRRGPPTGAKKGKAVKGKDKKGRVLLFDEDLGRAVVQRPHKPGKLDDPLADIA